MSEAPEADLLEDAVLAGRGNTVVRVDFTLSCGYRQSAVMDNAEEKNRRLCRHQRGMLNYPPPSLSTAALYVQIFKDDSTVYSPPRLVPSYNMNPSV